MKYREFRISIFVLIVACFAKPNCVIAGEHYAREVAFARDIQPLLAKHCLLCHGPDEAEGGLRLDSDDQAYRELDSGHQAVVPGDVEASELIHRVTSRDDGERMPPEGKPLTAEEVAALKQWIREGGEYEQHWAYQPLDSDPPPERKDGDGVRVEFDRYVFAKLAESGIQPSPAADRYTLIKRLYYDLLGLPPEPAEVDAFVNDPSQDAYEALVDRLLASPHFGERWARHWLDKARYADSDGYEKDNHRADAWRYRDWVIQAINDNMPFDQFTIEQLAGDLLPHASPQQKLATAFNRQTLTNTEGGADQEQWRVAAVMDRTETLGAVWLGLTVGCARCHTHKYDQITQREYYQLFAYFNNGDEVKAEVPETSAIDATAHERMTITGNAIADRRAELRATIDQWLPKLQSEATANNETKIAFHVLDHDSLTIRGPEGASFTAQEDGSTFVSGSNPATAQYTIEATAEFANITGLRVEVLPDDRLPARGPGRASHGNFVLNEVRLFAAQEAKWTEQDQQPFVAATADFSQDSWPVANAFDGIEGPKSTGTGWAISPKMGKPHDATFALKKPLDSEARHLKIELSQTYGDEHTLGRFRLSAVTGSIPGVGMPTAVREALLAESLDPDAINRLVDYYQEHDPLSLALQAEWKKLTGMTGNELMNVRVIRHRSGNLRPTHILRRGEFKQPLDAVATGTLASLPPVQSRDNNTSTDTLDLARWLVSGENPLVPRVAVNHIWKHLFGKGIVPTVNDFGVRGDPPTHPALLDHLAQQFIESGWSRKALIKTIVLSATYRQSSRHRPELADIDPSNRLLHRQNRFRVEAEIIRDVGLAASGLLTRKIGGPSVFPPIPPSVTELTYNSSFKWKTSEGEQRYRRGMYTYFKRTAPHPNLITFDCPDSNVTNVERDRSNTPIGALVTLNNETFVEAAQGMAQHVLAIDRFTDDRAKLQHALRRCIARVPSDAEVDDFAALLGTSRQWYAAHPDAAQELLGNRPAKNILPVENAAWIATLRVILNLDEFLTRE